MKDENEHHNKNLEELNHCLEDKDKEIHELKHLLKELADKPVEHHDEVVVSEHEDEESDHGIPDLEANV